MTSFINGGFFDAFEYFKCIYDNSIDKDKIYLFYIFFAHIRKNHNDSITAIYTMLKDKYVIDDADLKNIIFLDTPKDIVRYKFNKVLVVENHTLSVLGDYLFADKCLVIVDPFIPSHVDYDKLNKKSKYHCFSEYLLYDWNQSQNTIKEEDK